MDKKLLVLVVVLCTSLLPILTKADDVQLTAGETINVTLTSPSVQYTLTSTTGISSIVVTDNLLLLSLDAGDSIKVTQTNGYGIHNNLSLTTACSGATASITFTDSVVITSNDAVVCTASSSGGSSGSSGGGGGGGGASVPTQSTTPTVPQTPGSTPGNQTSQTTGQLSYSDQGNVTHYYFDPSNKSALLSGLGQSENVTTENTYQALIKSDAQEFGVVLSPSQLTDATNFVSYGISIETKMLGAGERRALLRDYFQTTKYANIRWDDIARLASGTKPVHRNLSLEQQQVSTALTIFKKIYGHTPNFKNSSEDLAWNTLMYRIRFVRDLVKEREGIKRFKIIFGILPKTPLNWTTVRILGYVNA